MKISKILKFFKIKIKDKDNNRIVIRDRLSERHKKPEDEALDWIHHSYIQRANECAMFLHLLEVLNYKDLRNILLEINKWKEEKEIQNDYKKG